MKKAELNNLKEGYSVGLDLAYKYNDLRALWFYVGDKILPMIEGFTVETSESEIREKFKGCADFVVCISLARFAILTGKNLK